MPKFLLLHSPLVGPTTWKWVAQELRSLGFEVEIPIVSPSATSRGWEKVVEEIVTQIPVESGLAFVAHSGAGPLLPTIVERSNALAPSMVFVDAGLPAIATNTPLMPEQFLERLATIAEEGWLPPWSEWFGPNVMASLVPDADKRELIEIELPRITLDYLAGVIPPVQKWPADRNGYVLLSDGYVDDAEEARHRGWPVEELLGQHLDLITRAPEVALAILRASSTY
jgi:hypothetical protein